MTAKRKLDVFSVLNHINRKDFQWFNTLSDDEQKAFAPVVVQRGLSGTNDALQILLINELVNNCVFNCSNQKDLLCRLMCCASAGQSKRHTWLKKKSNTSSTPISLAVVKQYYKCSSQHALENLELLTVDDVAEMAMDLGYEKPDIAKIKKEMK